MPEYIFHRMLNALAFLGVTYVPLQVYALWKCRGSRRVLAALPIPIMTLMILGAADRKAYEDGSLFGMNYIFFYLPSMLWLVGALCDPRSPTTCPKCGHVVPVKSFQFFRSKRCDKCKIPLQ